MTKTNLKTNHWYKFKDEQGNTHIGQFIGRQEGFECCVCGKGNKAYCFNIWYDVNNLDYETWGYGKEHLPLIIEDLGESEEIIVDL